MPSFAGAAPPKFTGLRDRAHTNKREAITNNKKNYKMNALCEYRGGTYPIAPALGSGVGNESSRLQMGKSESISQHPAFSLSH